MSTAGNHYDYIIVGAGSAGCALAYRLTLKSDCKVLLLEAGGRDSSPLIHIPLGFAFLMKESKINWCYRTQAEPNLNNRELPWPRGKVLGGTSSINGMVYIRGQREDFDSWAKQGNTGWSYDDVLPYFKRSEHNTNGSNEYHGSTGPLWVGDVADETRLPLSDLFTQAAIQVGMPHNTDFNGATQEGVGAFQVTIHEGRRQSTARTFLKACEQRPNLEIITGALAERVLFEGSNAAGVEYSLKRGKTSGATVQAHAKAEVILCGGTINSSQLLELSGIGERQRLTKLGIAVQQDLPGVGENLQDHLTVNTQYGLCNTKTFYEEAKPLAFTFNLLKYLFKRTGLLANPASQVGAFFRTSEAQTRPDAQIHFAPAASEPDKNGTLKPRPGCTATVCHLRPESRGSVHICSSDPAVHPIIHANYLDTQGDREALIAGVRKTREIFTAAALDKYRDTELLPGKAVQSDEEILSFIRSEANSVYHPVGTCKMGADPMAVVDSRLRVHGVEGLRVADASIMPTIISGNTNAASIMIGEKCADMLLQDAGIGGVTPAN